MGLAGILTHGEKKPMTKEIELGGKIMHFRATARTPKLYRAYFGRDLITEMSQLVKAYEKKEKNGDPFTIEDLEIFERVTWLFLKQGGEKIPDNIDEWLDTVDGIFTIYELQEPLMALWAANMHTTAVPKKK